MNWVIIEYFGSAFKFSKGLNAVNITRSHLLYKLNARFNRNAIKATTANDVNTVFLGFFIIFKLH